MKMTNGRRVKKFFKGQQMDSNVRQTGTYMNQSLNDVSVIIATYNGENYIVKQLESIRNQTRKLDEVIIVDDIVIKLVTQKKKGK